MTLGVFVLAFFVMRTVFRVMNEEAKNPYKVYQGTATPTYNTNAYVMKVSAHKSGGIAVNHHRQSGRSVARQSTPNVYVPLKSVEQGIFLPDFLCLLPIMPFTHEDQKNRPTTIR